MDESPLINTSTEEIHPAPCCNPNVRPGTSTIPIPYISLLDGMTNGYLHVFPEQLDLDRLRRSIATLCGVIPTLSARYKSVGTDYYFELSQSPIRLTTALSKAEDPVEDPGHRYQVNQHGGKYDTYLPPLKGQDILPNVDSPLIAFQYTSFGSGISTLALSIGHILGDGETHQYIIQTLSDIYEADGVPDHLPYPRFDLGFEIAHLDSVPPLEERDPSFSGPIVTRADVPEKVMEQYVTQGHAIPLELVTVSLSPGELSALRKRCEPLTPGLRLSRIDLLAGWVGSMPERLEMTRYKILCYVFNLRSVTDIPSTYSGDATSSIMVDIDEPSKEGIPRIASIARSIRQSINKIRSDPAYVKEWLELTAHEFYRLRTNDYIMSFAFHPDELYINSYASFDYAVTFGFPKEKVRVHQSARAHLRGPMISAGMPGTEERGIEVGFMVEVGQAEKVKELIEQDRQSWMCGI